MRTLTHIILLLLLVQFACQNDDAISPQQTYQGSLFVTVKDPSGLPVNGALIVMGDQSAITSEDGTYFFTQATLTGDDYLQVEKSGYFKGSRRFTARESQLQFLQVTLMPQEEIGTFTGTQPASISIDSKSDLTFPSNAVVRSDGSLYTGNVHVMASPIYGDDPQLSEKMPGTLSGLDESGTKVLLGSYGMLAVELQADNGDILNIAPGKTVEMKLAIPDKQLSSAPATIPLWYFDETKGYWIQEGEATKQGDVYVAELPHFSFWNCDDVFTLINWEGRFVYSDGKPAQNVRICLTIKSRNDQRCTNTNSDGIVSGEIAANEVMQLDVVNDCESTIFSEEIGPFNDDAKTDTKTIQIQVQDYATISGVALACDGSPITEGFVKVKTPKNNFIFPITDAQGHFEGGYTYCTGDLVTVTVYDFVNSLVSLPQIITFDRSLVLTNLKACEQVDEFIRYTIKGFSPEYIYYFPELTRNNFHITKIVTLDSIGVKGRFGFSFDGNTTGQYQGFAVAGNRINLPSGQTGYVVNMTVNVTEYGAVGEYIKGDFSGKISTGGNGSGGPTPSDFNGTFAVRNE